jgi:hypothetical protein
LGNAGDADGVGAVARCGAADPLGLGDRDVDDDPPPDPHAVTRPSTATSAAMAASDDAGREVRMVSGSHADRPRVRGTAE